jgi:hypothetical protein
VEIVGLRPSRDCKRALAAIALATPDARATAGLAVVVSDPGFCHIGHRPGFDEFDG